MDFSGWLARILYKRVEKGLKKAKLREDRKQPSTCEVEKEEKEPLLVIIQVYPQIVNITGILESSNEVAVQWSLDNDSLKIEKYLQQLKKKYDLKLFHAKNISLDDVDGYLAALRPGCPGHAYA